MEKTPMLTNYRNKHCKSTDYWMGSKDQSNYHWNSNSIHYRNRKSYVKTDTISQKTLNSQGILIWESQAGGITLVSKHTSEPKYHNSHDTILKHWNRKDGRERSPHGYSHKMFDKSVENKHGEKKRTSSTTVLTRMGS